MSQHLRWCIYLASFFTAHAACAEDYRVGSESMPAEFASAKVAETWRASTPPAFPAATVRFQRLADERVAAVKRYNADPQTKRLQIGIQRDMVSEVELSSLVALDWQPVSGGKIAHIDIVSPGALALRTALRADRLPDGLELRVAGDAMPNTIFSATANEARALTDGNGWFWGPITDGERQRLELFVPDGVDTVSVQHATPAISHLFAPVHTGDLLLPKDIGDSGSCNINAVCRDDALGAAYVAARNAVAWMVFQSGPSTFICTGTLLSDADQETAIPWFYTAHHCIGTQAEASTLETYWRREASTCNGTGAGDNERIGGGAELMYSASSTDGALLRLNSAPPASATFSGWNANPLSPNTPVIAIHHPRGDNKKYSRGTYLGLTPDLDIGGQIVSSTLRASWQEGTTEGGSSGSGLFTLGNSGYELRGGLFGGSASCANSNQPESAGNRDFYSSFERVFSEIRQYIFDGTGGNGPTRNYTGQWHNDAEAGRGLSLFQTGDTLFGLWFVYDNQGRASWYQIENIWTGTDVTSGRVVRWTGSPWGPTYNPDARSFVEVGTYTLTFTSASQATFSYNVDGVNRTVTFVKITGG